MSATAAPVVSASAAQPQPATGSAAAPVVSGAGAEVQCLPVVQPVQYVEQSQGPSGQAVLYLDEAGQPVYADQSQQPVQYVDEAGNPVQLDQGVEYVDEFGNPVNFAGEQGNPGLVYGAPLAQGLEQQAQQPAVFNVSPEIFAKLAQGGTLTQEEMEALTGAAAAPAEPDAAAVTSAQEAPAAVASASDKKSSKSSKKKQLSSKKSKTKGCC